MELENLPLDLEGVVACPEAAVAGGFPVEGAPAAVRCHCHLAQTGLAGLGQTAVGMPSLLSRVEYGFKRRTRYQDRRVGRI